MLSLDPFEDVPSEGETGIRAMGRLGGKAHRRSIAPTGPRCRVVRPGRMPGQTEQERAEGPIVVVDIVENRGNVIVHLLVVDLWGSGCRGCQGPVQTGSSEDAEGYQA